MSVYVTGDTHGAKRIGGGVDGYLPRLSPEAFPEQKDMTKDDFVVILGDFGGVWRTFRRSFAGDPYNEENLELDVLDDKPFTTLFVPGNHENYNRLTGCEDERLLSCWLYADMPEDEKVKLRNGFSQKSWHGGTVREIRPSVLMLEPGVFDLCGKKCFVFGGAPSHDIQRGLLKPWEYKAEQEFCDRYNQGGFSRVEGISWWSQEIPSAELEEQAVAALERENRVVDYIFTHDCASSEKVMLGFNDKPSSLNVFLEDLMSSTEYRHHFFGHYHCNETLPGGKASCLYEQIIRVA